MSALVDFSVPITNTLVIRLPEQWAHRSMEAALKVMEDENVVTIPSSIFGVEGFLRVTFVASPEKLREGIRRIRSALS